VGGAEEVVLAASSASSEHPSATGSLRVEKDAESVPRLADHAFHGRAGASCHYKLNWVSERARASLEVVNCGAPWPAGRFGSTRGSSDAAQSESGGRDSYNARRPPSGAA